MLNIPGQDRLDSIRAKYDRVKSDYSARDAAMGRVEKVRDGNMQEVYPELFPAGGPFSEAITANMVQVAARDLAETLAPLPSFDCDSADERSDKGKRFASKRTQIANSYIENSNVQAQMYTAADAYFTYSFVPAMVEIDAVTRAPRIVFLDPQGAYPVFNKWGDLSAVYFTYLLSVDDAKAQFPKHAAKFSEVLSRGQLEIVRYHDDKHDMLFWADGTATTIIESTTNPVGECLAEWVELPGHRRNRSRGQFDDVIPVQVAKARFALLSLEAATKSVQAPIAIPQDAQELALGADALIRTSDPQGVRRVSLDVPREAFVQQAQLDTELRQGSRYPNVRSGEVEGSIVTGRGVSALMTGFDTQIRTGQAMFARAFRNLVRKCFLVDDKVFADVKKTVRGSALGTPYELTYTPARDIAGDYTVDVQYGLMAGLNPNQALVFGLQARGDNLISRQFLREQMPFALNGDEEDQQIDLEQLRDGLKQALMGYVQALPVLAQAGQNPADLVLVLSKVIAGRAKGVELEKVVLDAFTPPEPPADAAVDGGGQAMPGDPVAGGGNQDLPGINDATGQLRGTAGGQAGLPLGGSPDLQTLLAGVNARGEAVMQAGVARRVPTM